MFKSRKLRLAEPAVFMEEVRNAYNCLAGRQREKDAIIRTCRQDGNIKIDYRGIMCGIVYWIQLSHAVV